MEPERPKLPYRHSAITEQIIAAFYTVYNALGHGFLEKVYENALVIELQHRGLKVVQQAPITVYYGGEAGHLRTLAKSGGLRSIKGTQMTTEEKSEELALISA